MTGRTHVTAPGSALSRITGGVVAIAAGATAITRLAAAEVHWGDRAAWLRLLGIALALLALRIAVLASAARRGELPWPRLLLPVIFWIEGVGVWWGDGARTWQLARLATAVALELTFVALAFRQLRRAAGDELAEDRLARSLAQLLPPRAARLVSFELVIMTLALRFPFDGRRPSPPGFTYHRDSPLRLFLPLLPLLGAGDVALLELVLLPHAPGWLRIVVHVLAVYGLLWVVGLWSSLRLRPHVIGDGCAVLHRGLLCRVEVPLAAIASVAPVPRFADDWKRRAYRKGAIRLDIAGPPALELRLREPVRPVGVLGPGRPGDLLLVSVDDPEAFQRALAAGSGA